MEKLHSWHEYFTCARLAKEYLLQFQIAKKEEDLKLYNYYSNRAHEWEKEHGTP